MDPINPKKLKIKNSLVLIMSILLIVTVGIACLFYFQIKKPSKELFKYQTQPSPAPTVTVDPTANWKTYADPLGYTFSYPKEFQLEKLKDRVIIRIDPPDMRNIVGICPRYISFSSANPGSSSKTSHDEYSCVYETRIESGKVIVEFQYRKNEKGQIDQILSTFEFTK